MPYITQQLTWVLFLIVTVNGMFESYHFSSLQEIDSCSNKECKEFNSLSYSVNTIDCSYDNNSSLFNTLTFNFTQPPHTFITSQYILFNISTYHDLYSPPPYFSIRINSYKMREFITMDIWNDECTSCVLKKLFLPEKTTKPTPFTNGTNTIQITSLINILCISDISIYINYRLIYPYITTVEPTLGPTNGGTNVTIKGKSIYSDYEYKCCFGDECTIFYQNGNDKGYCLTPPNTEIQRFDLIFNSITNGRHLVESNIFFEYYNAILTSVKIIQNNGNYYIDIHGNGFVYTPNALCKIFNETYEIILSGNIEEDNIICVISSEIEIQTLQGNVFNVTVSLNGIDFVNESIECEIDDSFNNNPFNWLNIIVIIGLLISILVIIVLFIILIKRKKYISDTSEFINPEDVVVENIIGNGSYGDVYTAHWRGQEIAVKLIPTQHLIKDKVLKFTKEVQLMKKFRHPCVLQFFGSGTDSNFILIAMELMKRGSAHGLLINQTLPISWERRLRMLKDCASGMFYLHTSIPPIIHLDLKSHNLLVDENWKVKVSDFGLSITSIEGLESNSLCGTLPWTSPEILKGKPINIKADVYSFAIVMWEFLTRSEPYPNIPKFHLVEKVGELGLRPDIPQNNHLKFCQLMQRSWETLPDDRPDFSEIIVILDELINEESCHTTPSIDEELLIL
ncbi:Map3k delta-1 protein kinase [Entamoeba marina]